jgi:hypothetical protein
VTTYKGPGHIIFSGDAQATKRALAVGTAIERNEPTGTRLVRFVPDFTTGRGVFVGGASQTAIGRFEEEVLPGVRDLINDAALEEPLYVDIGQKVVDVGTKCLFGNDPGGCYWHVDWAKTPYHHVALPAKKATPHAAQHETVHAIREDRGAAKEWDLYEIEEVETVLATVATMPPDTFGELVMAAQAARTRDQRGKILGYYGAFRDPVGAMLYDRVLMTGALEKSIPFDRAHARSIDDEIQKRSNIRSLWLFYVTGGARSLDTKTLADGSLRLAKLARSRRAAAPVYTVRVSATRRSKRLAPGAAERLFYAFINGRELPIRVTQAAGVARSAVIEYLSKRLGAAGLWECRGCRRVKVA